MAGVDRGDQLFGLGIPGNDGAPALGPHLRDAREQLGTRQPRHVEVSEHRRDIHVCLDHFERLLTGCREQDRAAPA
jgi:hypothetical protein